MSEQIASLEVSGSNPSRCFIFSFFFSSCLFFFVFFFFLPYFPFPTVFIAFLPFPFISSFFCPSSLSFFSFLPLFMPLLFLFFLFLHFSFSLSYQLTSAEGLHFSALVHSVTLSVNRALLEASNQPGSESGIKQQYITK